MRSEQNTEHRSEAVTLQSERGSCVTATQNLPSFVRRSSRGSIWPRCGQKNCPFLIISRPRQPERRNRKIARRRIEKLRFGDFSNIAARRTRENDEMAAASRARSAISRPRCWRGTMERSPVGKGTAPVLGNRSAHCSVVGSQSHDFPSLPLGMCVPLRSGEPIRTSVRSIVSARSDRGTP